MHKKELIAAIAERTGQSKAATEATVDAFQAVIGDTLAAGDKVVMVGFGTFSVRETAERSGRNPQTGDPITIPALKTPTFKAGAFLKECVR